MKNLKEYNHFVQLMEKKASGGLFFHHINNQIYITDHTYKLLGIWDITQSEPIPHRLPNLP